MKSITIYGVKMQTGDEIVFVPRIIYNDSKFYVPKTYRCVKNIIVDINKRTITFQLVGNNTVIIFVDEIVIHKSIHLCGSELTIKI